MISKQVIALFVKPPVPGKVKTRLARDIGDQAACDIYQHLADHAIQQALSSSYSLTLFFDGSEKNLLPIPWQEASQICLPQQGNNLGERMADAFRRLFADGVDQAVLIGSDIPGIDAEYLQQAFQLLLEHEMVIGPTLDGGYCLIGFHFSSFTKVVFQDIPWSTHQVFERTLSAVKNEGLSIGFLPELRDIDTVEDLRSVKTAKLAF